MKRLKTFNEFVNESYIFEARKMSFKDKKDLEQMKGPELEKELEKVKAALDAEKKKKPSDAEFIKKAQAYGKALQGLMKGADNGLGDFKSGSDAASELEDFMYDYADPGDSRSKVKKGWKAFVSEFGLEVKNMDGDAKDAIAKALDLEGWIDYDDAIEQLLGGH